MATRKAPAKAQPRKAAPKAAAPKPEPSREGWPFRDADGNDPSNDRRRDADERLAIMEEQQAVMKKEHGA